MISYLEFVTPTNATPLGSSVHSGDKVLLSMYFESGNVVLKIYDWDSGVSNEVVMPGFNATYFVGGPYENGTNGGAGDYQGHFSGLMTEWVHSDPYNQTILPVKYTRYTTNYSYAKLFVVNSGRGPTSLICLLDIYNLNKPILSQSWASNAIKINGSLAYNYSPYNNITLQINGDEFITK
jgi:hypothetical protein